MGFVGLSSDYIKSGYTPVDNVFLLSYLPYADATDVKIYLLGLALASIGGEEDNSLEKMSLALKLDQDRVTQGFKFWEEKGLVSLTKTAPYSVKYLSVKNPLRPIIKVNAEKYKVFTEEVSRLFPDRILSPNEYNEYFELMHTYKVEINAMLLIMQYCKDLGGGKFSTPYILAVANDWIKQGITTEKKVSEHIEELENNSEDIRQIFQALGIKRGATLDDRQMFLKWTKKYGYNLDAILASARSQKKRGGMERLDEIMEELKRAGAFSAEEVANYLEKKEEVRNLAAELARVLGTYYGNLEPLIDNYVQPWLGYGFEKGALLKLAKFCFLRNMRTFDALSQMAERFYKEGLISEAAIDNFVDKQLAIEEKLKEIFFKCNRYGTITNRDRESYKTWHEWGFSDEAIMTCAEICRDAAFPMQAINRQLASFRNRGIFAPEEIAKSAESKAPAESKQQKEDFIRHEYTDEQLKSVLVNFDDWEGDWE